MLLKKVKNWIKDKSTYPVKSVGRPRLQVNEMAVRKAYSEGISIAEIDVRKQRSVDGWVFDFLISSAIYAFTLVKNVYSYAE